jgi:hypothetical protein
MKHKQGTWFRRSAGALLIAVAACGTLLLVPGLYADDGDPAENTAPAPRAVRLASVEGQVQISQGNQPLLDQAVANTPLFEGTQVTTGNDGRAEIQFEDGSIARISPASSLFLAVLRGESGSGDAEVVLSSGLGYFELKGENSASHLRVRFGDSVVTANGFTVARVNLDTQPSELAVFSGDAHLDRGSNVSVDVHGGESLSWNGMGPGNYNLAGSIEPDSWDSWNSDRDQALATESANRTVATNGMPDNKNPAWGDLDANGSWYDVPDEGYVWSPYEAAGAGWDPYGSGYWMSSPGYGYAWISAEPWGYMPYHCGNWSYYNSFGWGWAPGGCHNWWGGGYYGGGGGLAVNIRNAPPGYRFPVLPPQHPHQPRPLQPVNGGGPRTLIPVNRRVPAGTTVLPVRNRNVAVTIKGNTVQPLDPMPMRPVYGRTTFTTSADRQTFGNASTGANASSPTPAPRPGYVRTTMPAVTSYSGGNHPVARPTGNSYARPAPSGHVSGGSAPAAHSSGGGVSHSSGGGGGGGSHGGGGGSHH